MGGIHLHKLSGLLAEFGRPWSVKVDQRFYMNDLSALIVA